MRGILNLAGRFIIPIIIVACLFAVLNQKWGKNHWKYTIISDGKGYYAYLPAVFIHGDLNLAFHDSIEKKYYDDHTKYEYRVPIHGVIINKYFAGVSVMQMPFFLIAHTITNITDGDADGYSKWYPRLMSLGALFWLAVGLIYLRKFLRLHKFRDELIALILFIFVFGTNLFYYTVTEPMMSHLYSFALVSVFLYYGKRWIETKSLRDANLTLLTLGMIVLVRPVNLLAALWLIYEADGIGNLIRLKTDYLRNGIKVVLGIVLFIFPPFVQMLIWKIQTGHWYVNSYLDEGFHFTEPHMIDFLFSYKKGMFVYLPITLVALFGLIHLYRKDIKRFATAFLFLFITIYILSSWWMWYYGGSFGTRVIIEYYPIFALLLATLISNSGKLKPYLITLSLILVLFCQFQTYQYRYELIHWSEMTAERYWSVFGKLP